MLSMSHICLSRHEPCVEPGTTAPLYAPVCCHACWRSLTSQGYQVVLGVDPPPPPTPVSLSTEAWYADQCQLSLMEEEAVLMTPPVHPSPTGIG